MSTIGLYRLNTHIGVTIWLSSLVIIILPAKGDQVMYIASIQCREMNVMCDHKRAPFHQGSATEIDLGDLSFLCV